VAGSSYLPDYDCYAGFTVCLTMMETPLERMVPDAALRLETAAVNGRINKAITLLGEDS
jgi:hypothetical protein